MPARTLALALALSAAAAAAQDAPDRPLRPDEVKRLAAKLRAGAEAGEVEALARAKVLEQFPFLRNLGPDVIDRMVRRFTSDPEMMRQFRDQAAKHVADGTRPALPPGFPPVNLPPRAAPVPTPTDPGRGEQPGPFPPRVEPTPKGFPRFPPRPADRGDPLPDWRGTMGKGFRPPPGLGPRDANRPPQPDPLQPDPLQPDTPAGPGAPPDPRADAPQPGPSNGPAAQSGRGFGPPRPFPPPPAPDPVKQAQRAQAYRAMAGFWEQNFGPVNETPGMNQVIRDVILAGDGLTDGDGQSPWAGLAADPGDGSGLGDWFRKASADGGWKWPELDLPTLDRGADRGFFRNWSMPNLPERGWSGRTPSVGSGWSLGWGGGGGGGSWWPVVAVGLAVAAGAGWWLFRRLRADAGGPVPLPGLGPWPIDPRHIADRAGVVTAFEYAGILTCGPGARAWNHATLSAALAADPDAAGGLGRAYAVARYAPAADPLPADDLAAARRVLCRLAGVPAP